MSKNLVIKLAISLIFAAFIYVLFWFFKVGQLEKRITKFISDNSAYVSSGSIETSGFPLSQNVLIKDLRFSIPNPILSNRQIFISEVTAFSGIFADSFVVHFPQGVSTQNSKGETAIVKFNAEPVVNVKVADANNVALHYEDSGYSMHDQKQNLILAVKSSKVAVSINGNDHNNIKVSVDSDIKAVEGFDVVDIYNNILRDDIIKGIQTGKIKVGSSHITENIDQPKTLEIEETQIVKDEAVKQEIPENIPPSLSTPPETTQENLSAEIQAVTEKEVANKPNDPSLQENLEGSMEIEQLAQNNEDLAIKNDLQVIVEEDEEEVIEEVAEITNESDQEAQFDPTIPPSPTGVDPIADTKTVDDAVNNTEANVVNNTGNIDSENDAAEKSIEALQEENLGLKNKYSQGVTSDLKISFTYSLVPNNANEELDSTFDPTKIQELPTQYNKEIKINNFEFSNKDYQLSANGTLSLVADDTLPSGNLSIIVQNHDNFIRYLKDYVEFYLTSKGYDLSPVKQPATQKVAAEIEVTSDNSQNVDNIPVVTKAKEVKENEGVETDETDETIKPVEEVKELVIKDSYDHFLKKIFDSITAISTEISSKNPASTNEESRYEIKREKNLEFKINDTPVREVLGKF